MEYGTLIGHSQSYSPYGEDASHLQFSDNYFELLKKLDTLKFYGAGHNSVKVDDIVFEVLEDPDDGYRSSYGGVAVTKDNNEIFFRQPIADVKIRTFEDGDDCLRGKDSIGRYRDGIARGYQLVDINDGHVWLEFGTDLHDGYYPYFYFTYNPKKPKN